MSYLSNDDCDDFLIWAYYREFEFEQDTDDLEDNFTDVMNDPFWSDIWGVEDNIEKRPLLIFLHEGEIFVEWWLMIEDGIAESDDATCVNCWAFLEKEAIENSFIRRIDDSHL